jgi:hypothetical protein
MIHLNKSPQRHVAFLPLLALVFGLFAAPVHAAPKASSLNIVPSITNIAVVNGQLLASGIATATIKGRVYTAPFSNVPVTIGLAPNQTNAPAGCPILDLSLAPINLDLLGLVVQTSPICLTVTAMPGGGLLGDLLCNISNLLNQGLNLNQILALLNANQLAALTTALQGLFNGALQNLLQAVLSNITGGAGPGACSILNLNLGPLNLTLLGLNVVLDNCAGGAVNVSISAHHGALLGNLLCNLTNHGLNLGTLLGDILGDLLNTGPL